MHPATARHTAASRPLCTLALAALALGACGGGGDPQKQIDTVSSWTATMQLALAERREHRTTRRHAAQLRDLARDAMEQSRSALAAQPLSADDARKAHASLDSLSAAIGALGREVGEP